ncbi:TaqI-like C-terminal specificity domain-containing protein [Mucilaginibacter sp. NFR10]|nr:TaqI-like C-terminal specificity domain-containing protein [Mucilaginibacter sp. NFR10]
MILDVEIRHLLNFEQVEVFEGVLVSSVILVLKNKQPSIANKFAYSKFYKLKNKDFIKEFTNNIKQPKLYNQSVLDSNEWSFADDLSLSIKAKIESLAIPIIDIEGVSIYRGVTTGFNPAFIIDGQKKSELIQKDEKNKNLIKPLLQGRNIRKWHYNKSDENLLFIPWHFPLNDDTSITGNSSDAEQGLKTEYPVLFRHLSHYREELSNRNQEETGIRYEWYVLQRCAASYHKEFEKDEKIIWGLTADKWAFAYDDQKHYLPSNGYILTSESVPIKLLLALLNSKLLNYYFGFIGIMTAGGAFTLKHSTIQKMPIIVSNSPQQIIAIVDEILLKKKASISADIRDLEWDLNKLIYQLYSLSDDEISIIENS